MLLCREIVAITGSVGQLKPGVHPVWLSRIRWWRFKTAQPSQSNAAEVSVDDDEGCPIITARGQPTPTRESLRELREGTLVDLLDDFETQVMAKYPFHKYTLHRTRASSLELHRSALPGWLLSDRDWSERYTIIDARRIQSEYWSQRTCGLFSSISSLLLQSAWDQRTGAIPKGSEVTIEEPGRELGFAVVTMSGDETGGDPYGVQLGGEGEVVFAERQHLRHRKWHTIAFCGVTGDAKQDAYATQHFVNKEIDWWKQGYVDTGKERISRSYTHSDNAYHFKSAKMENYLSRIPLLFTWLVVAVWNFGCGGHGKGVWDGFGGLFKRILRSDTIDDKIETGSGTNDHRYLGAV